MHFVGFTSDNNPSSSLTRACLLPRYSTYAIITFINYSINYSNLAILPRNIYGYTLNLDILPNTPTYASQ